MNELIASRRGSTVLDTPGIWLFPGRQPGHPISTSRLTERLREVGVRPRQDRNTALFTLAGEVPAALLARMLGIRVSVAAQWQRVAASDWTGYAADLANRPPPTGSPAPGR